MVPLSRSIVKHNNPGHEARTAITPSPDFPAGSRAIASGKGVGWTAGNDGSIIVAFLALRTVLRKRRPEMRQI